MAKKPKIFHVNWFRTDEKGKYLWPGFGENLRILEWVISRCRGKVDAKKTELGFIPYISDIDLTGLPLPRGNMEKLFKINKDAWHAELEDQKKFFELFGKDLPPEIWEEYDALKKRLSTN